MAPLSSPHSGWRVQLNPLHIRINKGLQEGTGFFRECAGLIKSRARSAQIGFWLLHARNIQEHQRLTKVMVSPKAANGARGNADHSARFAAEDTLTVRARSHIDGVFQRTRH